MTAAQSLMASIFFTACQILVSCGDEADTPSGGCAQRDLDVCEETKTQCDLDAETADNPRTAREACTDNWCTCVEAAGCVIEDYRECTED